MINVCEVHSTEVIEELAHDQPITSMHSTINHCKQSVFWAIAVISHDVYEQINYVSTVWAAAAAATTRSKEKAYSAIAQHWS